MCEEIKSLKHPNRKVRTAYQSQQGPRKLIYRNAWVFGLSIDRRMGL
jgi:hypothetical protein